METERENKERMMGMKRNGFLYNLPHVSQIQLVIHRRNNKGRVFQHVLLWLKKQLGT